MQWWIIIRVSISPHWLGSYVCINVTACFLNLTCWLWSCFEYNSFYQILCVRVQIDKPQDYQNDFFSFWRLNWEKKHARHGMRDFREGWARKIFQIRSETSLCISRWKKECKARTFSISLSGFLGFANVYAMRVNLSVAIVYMAGEKGMAWKESQQGFILGEIWKVLAVYWQFLPEECFSTATCWPRCRGVAWRRRWEASGSSEEES